MALSSGAIRKGLIEQGQGSEFPADGDMVEYQYPATCQKQSRSLGISTHQTVRIFIRC